MLQEREALAQTILIWHLLQSLQEAFDLRGLVKAVQADSCAYNSSCTPELHPEEGHNTNKRKINFTPPKLQGKSYQC